MLWLEGEGTICFCAFSDERKAKPGKKKPESNRWLKNKSKYRVLSLGGERQRWGSILKINTVVLLQLGRLI